MTTVRGTPRKRAPRKDFRGTTRVTVTLLDLPPEAAEALAGARNRSALIRDALAAWARAGPEREALARIEALLRDLSARLAALEAGGVVPAATAPASPGPPEEEARRGLEALAAWVGGD